MNTFADYEIFLNNGSSFIIKKVKKFEMSVENSKITSLTVGGPTKIDKIEYISLSDISCIVRRKVYTRWWDK
jgi:hypothetical protein